MNNIQTLLNELTVLSSRRAELILVRPWIEKSQRLGYESRLRQLEQDYETTFQQLRLMCESHVKQKTP